MSRSYKKYPVFKCGRYITKSECARKFRRKSKQLINSDREPLYRYKEVVDPWDICDCRFYTPIYGSLFNKSVLRK